MLDLTFSPEQEMLRETVRGVVATTSPLSVVRELEDDPTGYSPELWKQLAHLDLIGLQLPEEYGGSGMTTLETVVLYEEFGRAIAPSPHFVSSILCGGTLARAGSADQKQTWLPGIVSGEAILTPAWLEPENTSGPTGVQLRAEPDGDGWTLTGTKRHVAFASSASRLVVLARTGDAPGDVDLFLVDPSDPGVSLTQQLTIGSDAQYKVELSGVRVGESDRIGPAGTGWVTWSAVMHEAIILAAAQAVGGARSTPWRSPPSTPRTGTSSTSRSAPSRHWPTTWPTRSPLSTGPRCSSTRRPGPWPRGAPSPNWRRWPSSTPAGRSGT